jgi:hypothetical protein
LAIQIAQKVLKLTLLQLAGICATIGGFGGKSTF